MDFMDHLAEQLKQKNTVELKKIVETYARKDQHICEYCEGIIRCLRFEGGDQWLWRCQTCGRFYGWSTATPEWQNPNKSEYGGLTW